jgi:transcriptional regulator with XRE-family HTH domain
MLIGDRIRSFREDKNLSQGDIEERTGLLRCYISRVENGHTIPALDTIEKLARALEVPLFYMFYDGEEPPQLTKLPRHNSSGELLWGNKGKEARTLTRFRLLMGKISDHDRKLLLLMAQKLARR